MPVVVARVSNVSNPCVLVLQDIGRYSGQVSNERRRRKLKISCVAAYRDHGLKTLETRATKTRVADSR
jgi:hypothetical protein